MAQAEPTIIQQAAEEMGAGDALLRRWIGCWVDIVAMAGLFFAPVMASEMVPSLRTMEMEPFIWAALGVVVLYFPVTEGIWGRSLGKLVTGLKVVDKNGRVPGFGRTIVRTLFRLVEVNPVLMGGVPAGIVLLCSKRKQRLGDIVAGTYVLSADRLKQMRDTDETLRAMRAASA